MKGILPPAALLLGVFSLSSAFAAPTQKLAWVSKVSGNDVADCGAVANPCRTFQYAHDNIVVAGGTIYVRDPGGYGPLAISKAIAVVNDGTGVASIAASVDGVSVAAGVNDAVLIKGLTIDGVGAGLNGIKVQTAGNVTIANCTVKGFKEAGIFIGSSSPVNFGVMDSLLTENKNNFWVQPSGSVTHAGFLENVVATRGDIAVFADGKNVSSPSYIAISLKNTTAAQNLTGVRIMSGVVTAQGVKAEFNGNGAVIDFGSLILSRSQFLGNKNYDVSVFGTGKVFSTGDNVIDNLSGSLTPFNYR